MNPMEILRNDARDAIRKGLEALGYSGELSFQKAPEGKGILALPCFLIAKEVGKNPVETAKFLEESFLPHGFIEKAVAYGPYLNFFPDMSRFSSMVVKEILSDSDYGSGERKDERILLEHTSANPTGPLHVGRARNPIIGDTIARILRKYGYP
jgi:arginyl-tRNA synthetase